MTERMLGMWSTLLCAAPYATICTARQQCAQPRASSFLKPPKLLQLTADCTYYNLSSARGFSIRRIDLRATDAGLLLPLPLLLLLLLLPGWPSCCGALSSCISRSTSGSCTVAGATPLCCASGRLCTCCSGCCWSCCRSSCSCCSCCCCSCCCRVLTHVLSCCQSCCLLDRMSNNSSTTSCVTSNTATATAPAAGGVGRIQISLKMAIVQH